MSKYKQDIIRLRKQEKTYDEIKEKLGCSKGTISYHCKQAGLEDIGKRTKEITEEEAEKINKLRLNGNNVKKVSKKLKISEASVKKYTTEETKKKVRKKKQKAKSKKPVDREKFTEGSFHKGVIAEEKVKTRFVELGYKIYDPVIRSVEDLVVETEDGFKKVQVKHGTYKNGCVVSSLSRGRRNCEFYDEDQIDVFAIYCSETEKVYIVNVEEAPNYSIRLRVENPNDEFNNHRIRWAENYEIEKAF